MLSGSEQEKGGGKKASDVKDKTYMYAYVYMYVCVKKRKREEVEKRKARKEGVRSHAPVLLQIVKSCVRRRL